MRRSIPLLAAMVVVMSCTNEQSQPTSPVTGAPNADISDGAHAGNQYFFWLPELVESPSLTGTFNAELRATVKICALTTGSDGEQAPPTDPECVGANQDLFTDVTGDAIAEHYSAVWKTDEALPDGSYLNTDEYYRLSAWVGPIELGYRDLDPEDSPPQGSGAKLNDFYPFNYGNTINIKFWIGEGALCLGDPENCGECYYTTSGTDDGNNDFVGRACNATPFAGVYIPPATPEVDDVLVIPEYIPVGGSVTLEDGTVLTCRDAGDGRVDFIQGDFALPQFPGCFTVRTIPEITGDLTNPAIVGVCPDIASDDIHAVIHRTDNAADPSWVEALNPASTEIVINGVPVDFLSCPSTAAPTGPISRILHKLNPFSPEPAYATHKSLKGADTPSFSDFVWAEPVQDNIAGGNNQTGLVETTLPTPLTVSVTDRCPSGVLGFVCDPDGDRTAESLPAAGAEVTFTFDGATGGLAELPAGSADCSGVTGSASTLTLTSGASGELNVCLTLPEIAGVYTVDAGGYGIGVRDVSWSIGSLTGTGPYSHFVANETGAALRHPIELPDPYVPVAFTATACEPGQGTASIDGLLGAGEWDCAGDPEPFEANLGGGKSTGFFYQMTSSDDEYLYLGVWVPVDKDNSLREYTLTFYLNDSGAAELTEGDDVLVVEGVTSTFFDQHWAAGKCPKGQSFCAVDDPAGDPMGQGAVDLNLVDGNPEFYFYEIKHPLCSGSQYDVCVTSTLNGALTFRWSGKGTKGNTEYPGPFGTYEQFLP